MGWNEYLVTGLNMALNFVTEYLYDRFVVFGASLDTNEKAKAEKEAEEFRKKIEEISETEEM